MTRGATGVTRSVNYQVPGLLSSKRLSSDRGQQRSGSTTRSVKSQSAALNQRNPFGLHQLGTIEEDGPFALALPHLISRPPEMSLTFQEVPAPFWTNWRAQIKSNLMPDGIHWAPMTERCQDVFARNCWCWQKHVIFTLLFWTKVTAATKATATDSCQQRTKLLAKKADASKHAAQSFSLKHLLLSPSFHSFPLSPTWIALWP